MIIDFHTHCFKEELAPKAMANLAKNSLYPPHFDGTLKGLKQSMAEAEIDISVICNIATNAHQNVKVNDWAIESDRETGIVSFGSIHPQFADYRAEIKRLKAAGIKGIKFHPDYQDFFINDRSVYPIFEEIAALDMIMLFHCGCDLVLRAPYHCPPELFSKFIDDFKGAKIVGAHLGGQAMWDEVFKHIAGKDVYLDTSFGFKFMSAEQIDRFVSMHDNDKILFATDTPWQRQAVEVREMRSFINDDKLLEKIFFRNAQRLLSI